MSVTQRDIEEGLCGLPSKCMHKVAIARALGEVTGDQATHVAVHTGQIKFNYKGFRYKCAPIPQSVANTLIRFDQTEGMSKKERLEVVTPYTYYVTFERKSRIYAQTRERQNQINAARNKRAEEGRPDKRSNPAYALKKRIIGLPAGLGKSDLSTSKGWATKGWSSRKKDVNDITAD